MEFENDDPLPIDVDVFDYSIYPNGLNCFVRGHLKEVNEESMRQSFHALREVKRIVPKYENLTFLDEVNGTYKIGLSRVVAVKSKSV